MSASMIASFAAFVIAGIYATLFDAQHRLLVDPGERLVVGIILLLNAAFYYYFAAHLEVDDEQRQKLSRAPRAEWIVRIINQTILFLLWFASAFGWGWFIFFFILLYVGYLTWDAIVWSIYRDARLVAMDIVGLAFAIAFAYVYWAIQRGSVLPFVHMMLGVIAFAYIGLIVAGIMMYQFNPLKPEYYVAGRRH